MCVCVGGGGGGQGKYIPNHNRPFQRAACKGHSGMHLVIIQAFRRCITWTICGIRVLSVYPIGTYNIEVFKK